MSPLRTFACLASIVIACLGAAAFVPETAFSATDFSLNDSVESIAIATGSQMSLTPSSRMVHPAAVTYRDGTQRQCDVETQYSRVDGQLSFSAPRIVRCPPMAFFGKGSSGF